MIVILISLFVFEERVCVFLVRFFVCVVCFKNRREQKGRWEELGEGKNMTKICCMENIIFQLENIKNKEIKCHAKSKRNLEAKGLFA